VRLPSPPKPLTFQSHSMNSLTKPPD
jgi:hypothetical protein